jgi:hypothetical protein
MRTKRRPPRGRSSPAEVVIASTSSYPGSLAVEPTVSALSLATCTVNVGRRASRSPLNVRLADRAKRLSSDPLRGRRPVVVGGTFDAAYPVLEVTRDLSHRFRRKRRRHVGTPRLKLTGPVRTARCRYSARSDRDLSLRTQLSTTETRKGSSHAAHTAPQALRTNAGAESPRPHAKTSEAISDGGWGRPATRARKHRPADHRRLHVDCAMRCAA